MRRSWLIGLLLVLLIPQVIHAQDVASQESIAIKEKHSPHKATIYSAVLPGLGQAYNKKYWKIPIVYAGFGTIGYFAITNRNEYRLAKDAFIYVSNGYDYETDNKYVGRYNETDLIQIRDYYRRNTELSWIIMSLWYMLNIVDATVDAHFFDYDISDNLSLHLSPGIQHNESPFLMQPYAVRHQTALSIRITF